MNMLMPIHVAGCFSHQLLKTDDLIPKFFFHITTIDLATHSSVNKALLSSELCDTIHLHN